ncbi:MAG: hypothetical protein H0V07_03350, partial [Propionibacteriales bacterium]|nr:hypothetical protein [Propionibacteriales bacterium]
MGGSRHLGAGSLEIRSVLARAGDRDQLAHRACGGLLGAHPDRAEDAPEVEPCGRHLYQVARVKVIAWDFPTLKNPRADALRMARAAKYRCSGCPIVA